MNEIKLKGRFCTQHGMWDYIGWPDTTGKSLDGYVHVPIFGLQIRGGNSTSSDDPNRHPWDIEAWQPKRKKFLGIF